MNSSSSRSHHETDQDFQYCEKCRNNNLKLNINLEFDPTLDINKSKFKNMQCTCRNKSLNLNCNSISDSTSNDLFTSKTTSKGRKYLEQIGKIDKNLDITTMNLNSNQNLSNNYMQDVTRNIRINNPKQQVS